MSQVTNSWPSKKHYIEWSQLCHKCDIITGCICKPGYKCDVNLGLNPYIVAVNLDRCHIEICPPSRCVPPIFQQCYARPILHPVLIGTVLLHHSLGLWTVYQRVLGFRPIYRTVAELLHIAIHVIRNYTYCYTDGGGGHILMGDRYWRNTSSGLHFWQASPVVPLLCPLNMNTNLL